MSRSTSASANGYDPDAAVARGAAWLTRSRHVRDRWPNYIDRATLDMGSIRHDVLAQLGARFEDLDLTLDQAIAYGFEPYEDDREHAAALTAAWRKHLSVGRKQVA